MLVDVSVTRRDMKHMAWAVIGLVGVIVGVSAIESGGLTWAGVVGALLVALYASAVVVAAIAFYATYRRHNPYPPAVPRTTARAQEPAPLAEEIEEPVAAPLPPAPDERPAPPSSPG